VKKIFVVFLALFIFITGVVYAGRGPGILGPFDGDDKANNLRHVPLRNQNDPKNGVMGDAACGPTALGMALEYFGKKIPTDQLIRESGMNPEKGETIWELFKQANKYLPNSHFSWGTTTPWADPMAYLKNEINDGGLVLVPVEGEYSNKIAGEGHFLLVTDYIDGKVYANDPAGGSTVVIPEKSFSNIWQKSKNSDRKPCVVIHK